MYKLIVISGRPDGYAATLRTMQGGLSVVLSKSHQMGDTYLNRGYVPTKALPHEAGPDCD